MGCTRPKRLEAGPGVAPACSFVPLVLDLAEESRCQDGVGLLDVGEVRVQGRSLDLESSILIDGFHPCLLLLAGNEVRVAVPRDLERIVLVLRVHPAAEEFRSLGCAPGEGDETKQADRDDRPG